ncbi:hypothetical protein ACXYTJ_07040 [Gilvimarinus sp. F26214L]|uniref:hypothetical protein n=1 Tax=Gilvimarinus sp. DZF01 TaxID=3461371 RepID=UPI004045987C
MKPKTEADREAVLMALDQLSQTMEVMSQVVSRLKRSVEQAEANAAKAPAGKSPQSAKQQQDRADCTDASEDPPTVLH